MNIDPLWIAGAAFMGALLGNVYKWLGSNVTPKQLIQGVITGAIAVAGYAIGYKFSDHTLNAYDLLSALVGGWGLVMSQSWVIHSLAHKRQLRRLKCGTGIK